MGKKLDTIRHEVRRILERSPAYNELPEDKKSSLARQMVKVSEYLSEDPMWLTEKTTTPVEVLGDDPIEKLKGKLAEKPGQVGQEFKAGAVREGVRAFRQLVDAVDFPDFVSGLIQGVFQAIVDASVQQMEAYAEMLGAVSKSVDEFAKDQISDSQARDYVANRYPSVVRIDTSGSTSKLKKKDDSTDTNKMAKDFNVKLDLDDEESEQELVRQAKLEMARSRQQLLATMVLLGINRIVVTNGRINAKVVFDIEASDEAKRRAKASLHDEQQSQTAVAAAAWGLWGAVGGGHSRKHKTTIKSSTVDTSESNIEAKAQLTGDVRLNFRSDTVPLERMVDRLDMQVLTSKAEPPQRMKNQRINTGA